VSTGLDSGHRRVPAAERREEMIEAAISEFARSGLHGTPVSRIAQRIGVAQPYVFSLFPTKRDLFLAAVERCFDRVDATFTQAAAEFRQDSAAPGETESSEAGEAERDHEPDIQDLLGKQAIELMMKDRDVVMLQLQSYAACDDELIQERVRARWAQLTTHVQQLTGADAAALSEFFSWGMWYTVMIAIGASGIDELCAPASTQHPAGATE
jgi:AcrR family transcriptional regulator